MRGPIRTNTVSPDRRTDKCVRLSSETVFLRIGPLFHQIGPRVSPGRISSKTNAPILKRHPVCKSVQQDDLMQMQQVVGCSSAGPQPDGGDRKGFRPGCGALQSKQRRSTLTDSKHRGHSTNMGGGHLLHRRTDPGKVTSLVGC